ILAGASGNTVGTNGDGLADAAERNVISGNVGAGVRIDASSANTVAGNYIGTDASGAVGVPNQGAGVAILAAASGNIIGGAGAVARNVISGNAGAGVRIDASTNNTVAGNYIGTNAAGTAALGKGTGVWVSGGSSGNVIGTNGDGVSDADERNVIS